MCLTICPNTAKLCSGELMIFTFRLFVEQKVVWVLFFVKSEKFYGISVNRKGEFQVWNMSDETPLERRDFLR